MTGRIPLVDYLVLGDDPHLEANECLDCGARYFGRRNACAACSGTSFHRARISTSGVVRGYTIVSKAAPGVPVPFVAGIIDCDGTTVRANLINVTADPDHVAVGAKVRLVTQSMGTDSSGTEAVGFGFEPLEGAVGGK
jgi:uncharacterized OB-fold protein